MKVQSASNLPSNRSSFLPKKRSPRHADSGYQSASTSSSPSMSPTASTSAQPATRPALAPRASSSNPQRPPLRRSSAGTAVICDKTINQQIAFERELQNLMEVEYRDDVQEYMYDMESRTIASVELIDQQPELQWYMRPYLVDFLVEIHQQHALRSETLYLAINIVDRYVSKRIVFKKHYQLVGCAALWIAAKFEDAKDRVPTVQELSQACCNAYEESAFIQMEGHVLSTIGWVLGHPTAEAWLRLASVGFGLEDQRVQHVSRFLMEITLFHRAFVAFKPSDVAVGSLMLARFMLGKQRRRDYETENVLRIVNLLDSHLGEHLDQVSGIVIKKYSFAFYSRSSTFAREWYLSGNRFALPQSPLLFSSDPCSSSPMSRSSSYQRSSSPLTSPSSESSFGSQTSDDCLDFDDEAEPSTPITPLSACSLVDPMDCAQSSPTVKITQQQFTAQHWDSSAMAVE